MSDCHEDYDNDRADDVIPECVTCGDRFDPDGDTELPEGKCEHCGESVHKNEACAHFILSEAYWFCLECWDKLKDEFPGD